MNKYISKLFDPVQSFTTEIFLRLFGLVILFQVGSYQKAGFIENGILTPQFLFTYDFFSWVKPFSAGSMKVIPLLLIASGILIILNKFRKIALVTFLILFSYLFLLEKSYYNNHFYLMILLAFLFLFYKPQKSNDGKSYIPFWFLLLLQIQIVVVYFYGGIAKLSTDWLVHMQPMTELLKSSAKNAVLPSLNDSSLALLLLTYGGLLFDLAIGFLLWKKETRKTAILLCLFFHGFNLLLFNFGPGGDIGIFPMMMMGSCVLFVNPELLRNKIAAFFPSQKGKPQKQKKDSQKNAVLLSVNHKTLTLIFFSFYLMLQLLLPFRHLIYKGNTSWTGRGNRFAWRMKVHKKLSSVQYYFQLNREDQPKPADIGIIINTMQQNALGEDPSMLLQMAHYLGEDLKKAGYPDAVITASAKVSLNGRPYQFIIDSTQNLLSLKHHAFKNDEWILPLKEEIEN